MNRKGAETLDPAPFRDWCEKRLSGADGGDALGAHAGQVTVDELAADLGIGERRLHRWRFEVARLERIEVEEALHRADVGLWEVYPDLTESAEGESHGYCPRCKEDCAVGPDQRCLWCDTPTRHRLRRGGKPAGVYGKLQDRHLHALHRFHREQGISIRELGRRIWEKAGYASPASAAESISQGFRRLSLPALPQHVATALANERRRQSGSPGTSDRSAHKRWMRKRDGGYRPCKGVKSQPPCKGSPCSRYASPGSDYCWVHDPARREDVVRQAAEMRARLKEAA